MVWVVLSKLKQNLAQTENEIAVKAEAGRKAKLEAEKQTEMRAKDAETKGENVEQTEKPSEIDELNKKMPAILDEMWRLSFTGQGYRYISNEIKREFGVPLVKLAEGVYGLYNETHSDEAALQDLKNELTPPLVNSSVNPSVNPTQGPNLGSNQGLQPTSQQFNQQITQQNTQGGQHFTQESSQNKQPDSLFQYVRALDTHF